MKMTKEQVRKNNFRQQPDSSGVKISQSFSTKFLDLLCSYLVSDNQNIRKKGYDNIRKVISKLNMSMYKDNSFKPRFNFIEVALSGRVDKNITSQTMIEEYIRSYVSEDDIKAINFEEMSNSGIDYINQTMTNCLDTLEFESSITGFIEFEEQYKLASPFEKVEIINKWKEHIKSANNVIRMNKNDKTDDQMYAISEMDDYVRHTHMVLSSPSDKLKTGIQALNMFLGGGFEAKRTYVIFGLQGEGKSSTLVDLAMQVKKYNPEFKPKDPTKRPAILYLTMEDHPQETLSRQFSMVTQMPSMTNYTADQTISMLKQGGLVVNDQNPIDIIVKYRPNQSEDTSYIYDIIDDLDDQGWEVEAVFLDYLARIRSVVNYSSTDERLRLGAVVNELKTIATELQIPIITASQFNRDANAKVDNARSCGKSELVNELNRSNIGESMKILDNTDCGLFIVPEFESGHKYLGIKMIKHRHVADNKNEFLKGSNVIHHPYVDNVCMKLMEDIGFETPISKLKLCKTTGEMIEEDKVNRSKDSKLIANDALLSFEDKKKKFNELMKKDIDLDAIKRNSDNNTPPPPLKPMQKTIPKELHILKDSEMTPEQLAERERQHQEYLKVKDDPKALVEKYYKDYGVERKPNRYTDDYDVYEQSTTKGMRIARDINRTHGTNYTSNDFANLLAYVNMCNKHMIKDDAEVIFPAFFPIRITKEKDRRPLFKVLTKEEVDIKVGKYERAFGNAPSSIRVS